MTHRCLTAGCIGVLLQLMIASTVFAADASLKTFWSISMPRRDYPVSEFAIWNVSADGQGSVAALVWNGNRYLILIGPKEQPPTPVELALKGKPLIGQIAHGPDNAVWLAGRANRRSRGPGLDFADPYLAKIDRTGRVVSEYTLKPHGYQHIRGLSPLASGNIIVVRQDGSEAWLGSITPGGDFLWQSRVPVDASRSIALGVLGQRILVAGIDVVRENGKRPREDAVLWMFDSRGVPVGRELIKQGLARGESRVVRLQLAREAVYLLTYADFLVRTPIEVVKVSNGGEVLWRREIPQTMVERPNKGSVVCEPGHTVTQNDNLLIACTIERQILFVRLMAESGKALHAFAPLPECHGGHNATLFPFERPNGSVWVLGSRPHSLRAPGCAWLGSVSLPW